MFRQLIALSVCIGLLLVAGCSQHSELHEAMEDMEHAYKAMKKADSIEVMKAEYAILVDAAKRASQQAVKAEDQKTFDKGMIQVVEKVEALAAVLDSGDIDAAKQMLKKLHDLEEDYHEKLGVEE